jgi:hypothetical protein
MLILFLNNPVQILPVCKTWEDMLWAHFNSLVVNATENHLRKFPRIRDDEYSEFTVPVVEQLTVPQIFDRILNCTDPGIAYDFFLLCLIFII